MAYDLGSFIYALTEPDRELERSLLLDARLRFPERLLGRSSFEVWGVRLFGDLLRRLLA